MTANFCSVWFLGKCAPIVFPGGKKSSFHLCYHASKPVLACGQSHAGAYPPPGAYLHSLRPFLSKDTPGAGVLLTPLEAQVPEGPL